MTVHGDSFTVDLSDSHPQVTGFINSSFPNMMSAVYMALPFLIEPQPRRTRASFRVVDVIAQGGHGRVGYGSGPGHPGDQPLRAGDRRVDHQGPRRRLPRAGDRRAGAAASGSPSKASTPVRDRQFIWHLFHARPGGGASPVGDGWETAGEGQAVGASKFGSIEVAETRFPLFFEHHEFRPDSFGDGKFRAARARYCACRMETDRTGGGQHRRRRRPPSVVRRAWRRATACLTATACVRETTRVLKTKEIDIPVLPGDVFFIESAGEVATALPRIA